ncbi:MAG: cell division protein CrgA [Acidimicrobiales bacterium]
MAPGPESRPPAGADRVSSGADRPAAGADRPDRHGDRPKKVSGRATPKGGRTASKPAASPASRKASGRYTPPIPKEQRRSAPWFGPVLLALLVLGLLVIVLNYVKLLPGGVNNYYLIGGIVAIVIGLGMATFYH